MLKKRKLGSCGLVVSELGLGCLGMSMPYGKPNDAGSISTIHHAIDKGITFFDNAFLILRQALPLFLRLSQPF